MQVDAVWNELVLQARLRYLMFKRSVWMFQSLLFLIVVLLVNMIDMPARLRWYFIAFALLRVVTEAINHEVLARGFNVPDRWAFLFPFR